jgi:oligosaccharide repeat unit polymerase
VLLSHKFQINLVILWYIIPYIILIGLGTYLPKVSLVLFFFFIPFLSSYIISSQIIINQIIKFRINIDYILKIAILVSVFLLLFAFYTVSSQNILSFEIREKYFEDSNIFFGSTYLYTLYNAFLANTVFLSIIWFSVNNYWQNRFFIIVGILFVILDGYLKQGRFQFLYIIFILFVFKKEYKLKTIYIFVFLLSLIFLIFYTLYSRSLILDYTINSFFDIFDFNLLMNSTINYQFYGYLYLEKLIVDVPFYGNLNEFNTISFIFFLINTFFLTKLGYSYNYPWENYNIELVNGMYSPLFDSTFNAFSTNFYPLFLDFGIFGIIFFGFISGFLIGVKTNNTNLVFLKILNLFVLLFGIYQPIFTYFIGFIYLFLCLLFLISIIAKRV